MLILTSYKPKPMIPHWSVKFDAFFRGTDAKLKQGFLTETCVFQVPCSGSGMQEASICNLVQKDMLSCVNCTSSQRWYLVAVGNGKQADRAVL